MHRSALSILIVITTMLPISTQTAATIPAASHAAVSLDPALTLVGGSSSERQTVLDAVGQFVEAGLALPDLEVRIHPDNTWCNGHMGVFHPGGVIPVIDLCFQREFLALHELGHAWEHFNIDDRARSQFQEQSGAPTWNSAEIPHSHRAIEIAADTLAYGLLSTPLTPRQQSDRKIALFEALTGLPSPRLALTDATTAPGLSSG